MGFVAILASLGDTPLLDMIDYSGIMLLPSKRSLLTLFIQTVLNGQFRKIYFTKQKDQIVNKLLIKLNIFKTLATHVRTKRQNSLHN